MSKLILIPCMFCFVFCTSLIAQESESFTSEIIGANCKRILENYNTDYYFSADHISKDKTPFAGCRLYLKDLRHFMYLRKKDSKIGVPPKAITMWRLVCFRIPSDSNFNAKSIVIEENLNNTYGEYFGKSLIIVHVIDQDKKSSDIPKPIKFIGISTYFLNAHWLVFSAEDRSVWMINSRYLVGIKQGKQSVLQSTSKQYKLKFPYIDFSIRKQGIQKSANRSKAQKGTTVSDIPQKEKTPEEKVQAIIEHMKPASKVSTDPMTSKQLSTKNNLGEKGFIPLSEAIDKGIPLAPLPSSPFERLFKKENKKSGISEGNSGSTDEATGKK